jgi:PAS domain S-box-containing protein
MPAVRRYGIAVLSVAIAIGLDLLLLRHFEAILTPFLFAVAATVWYAGIPPGVLAIFLSVLSLNYFFLRPVFSFSPISYADLVYLTFCTFCALAVGWVSAVRRRTEQELRRAREELDAKVVERTASLQRSEEYLAEAQRLSHCGVAAYNETTVLYGSEEIYRIWGFDPAQGVPSREAVFQRIHPDDRDRLNAEVQRAVGEKRRYSTGYRIVLPDGTVKHLESIGRPVFSASGELVEIVTTQLDVTERTRAGQALRESEAKFRDYAESASDWYWETDPHHKFTRVTDYEQRLARGFTPTSRIGLARWEFATDVESEPEKWERHRSMLEARQPFRDFVYRAARSGGSLVYYKISGKPVFDANGEFRGYRGTGTDVTAIMRAQEVVRECNGLIPFRAAVAAVIGDDLELRRGRQGRRIKAGALNEAADRSLFRTLPVYFRMLPDAPNTSSAS